LKVFNKNRQEQILEKQFANYLKYAAGEIVLLVIGILLALQVNNWNEDRVDRIKETEYLTYFKEDLQRQIIPFDELIGKNTIQIINTEKLEAEFKQKGTFLDIDSMNLRLVKLLPTYDFPVINTTFQDVNSTGQINLIHNKLLRNQIIEYYQLNDDYSETIHHNITEVTFDQVFPVISSCILPEFSTFEFVKDSGNHHPFPENLRDFVHNQLGHEATAHRLMTAIGFKKLIAYRHRGLLEDAKAKANNLLEAINQELN
jgi:hypothetical protein